MSTTYSNKCGLCHQELPEPLYETYRLELNRWRGNVTLQLNIQHMVETVVSPPR